MELENRIRKFLDESFKGYYLEKYILKDGKRHPVAIICPGGGYRRVCSFVEGLPFARKLNAMGYSAVVVHYRCGKKNPYPVPQADLARAIRHVLDRKDRWNLDMENYSLWGASAGGHLAASFGTDAMGYKKYNLPKPAALILTYPVVTMGEKTHMGSRNHLLGEEPLSRQIELTSIEKQITPNYPPTFLWCGLEDRSVDPENSRMLAAALKKHRIPHRFVPIAGVGHGVGLGEGLPCEGWLEEAVGFWENQMRCMDMKVLSFGEVLWDVYPDEKFLGGAPLNFAAHLAKHGKTAYMVSSVGDDALGEEAVSQMRHWGVRTDYVSCSSEKETGKCLVTLDTRSVPSYNLLRDVAYDQIRCDDIPDTFDVLYFGTLALRSAWNFETLKALLREKNYKEVFVDINIRPPFCSDDVVTFAVANATMLKISEEELPAVCNALGMPAATAHPDFAKMLAQRHEKLKCIIITLGADGAYVLDCRRQEDWSSGSAEVEVVSTVGAGDSFSAAFLAKYMDGCSMDDCLKHAIQVAGYVVSKFDAVPDYTPDAIL